MQIHGSCASRAGDGVLLIGPPGAGKSDLLLRLLARGFELVADDCVDVVDGIARPAPALAGLFEVRGLGIVRLPHIASARLALVVVLAAACAARMPAPARHDAFDLPQVTVDPRAASAPERVALALDCALHRVIQVAGAFAA
jgi:HPr kinase/phosphorylase